MMPNRRRVNESSLITDVRDLQVDVLVRKALECRRHAKSLEKYPEPDVQRAYEDLRRCIKRLEDELKRRSLSLQEIRTLAKRRT